MATYYHVSLDIHHTGVFTPKVPEDRYEAEDSRTNRICVSDTIKGCFDAIPDNLLFTEDHHGYFKLFEINTDDLAIPANHIVKPFQLYEEHGVYDALLTNEHWLKTGFTVPAQKQFICQLAWFEEFSNVALSSTQLTKLAASLADDMRLPTDRRELFDELFEFANDSTTRELELRTGEKIASARNIGEYGIVMSYSPENQDVYLKTAYGDTKCVQLLAPYIRDAFSPHVQPNEIQLSVPKNTDIRELLLAHYRYVTSQPGIPS